MRLTVTPQAHQHIQKTITESVMAQPVILVAWSAGDAELSRGPSGEAVWQRGPQGWVVTVADLAEIGALDASKIEPQGGLPFIFALRANDPSLEGCELRFNGGPLAIEQGRGFADLP